MNVISIKVMFTRLKDYLGSIQFAMIGYLFVMDIGFNIYLAMFGIGALCMILAIVDYKWLLPKEQQTWSYKNPVMMEMLERIKRIEEKCPEKSLRNK